MATPTAPPRPLQPPPAPRVLHGRPVQPEDRRPVAPLLPVQTRRTANPHPGRAGAGPPGRRLVGTAARQPEQNTPPHHQPSKRLDTIMRFVLAALRALHPDPGSGSAISGCRGERRKNGTPEQGSPRSRRGG